MLLTYISKLQLYLSKKDKYNLETILYYSYLYFYNTNIFPIFLQM